MKLEIAPMSFTLPHPSPYKLGEGIVISKLMDNLIHIEKALQKQGIVQCRNCNEIVPYSSLGIGGVCETCWIEDETLYDADFSALTDHEILRHLRKLLLFSDMARKDSAIKKENPNHKFSPNHDFMLRESYLGIFSKFDHSEVGYRWNSENGVHEKK